MRKTLLAAIMAASALIPAAAMAQDNPERPARGDGQPRAQRPAGAQPRQGGAQPQRQATPGAEGRTQWQRPNAPAQAQAPAPAQPQVQAAPQQRAGGRPDGQAGGRGYRGGDRGQQFQGVPAQPQQGRGQFQGQLGGRPDVNGGRDGRQGFDGQQRGGDLRDNRGGFQQNGRGPDYRGNDGRGNDGRGYNGGYNTANRGGWSRDWRRDNRYNYNVYRTQNRNAYHLPRYYAPYGWDGGYRRFGIGFSLNSILFDQSYWIEDTDYYRLPPAYGPYRWVRYYNDALLVDIRTGQVVDTVYDIFW